MRTKHKIKAAALSDLSIRDKWLAAYLGDRYHPEAITLVDLLTTSLYSEIRGESLLRRAPEKYEEVIRPLHKRAWLLLLTHFRHARNTNDGSFFRKMADTIEALDEPIDARQAAIAEEIMRRKDCNQPMPTVPEMVTSLTEKGIPAKRQTVHRIFGYLRVIPAEAPRGRPRKRPK